MVDSQLPEHASVVVIGGGVMGCSTLYHLAKEGASDAILLERKQLTSGTTWHSAAQVRALRSSRNLTELIRYSARLYSELEAETGQSTGWIKYGSLSIATNPDRLTHIRRQESLAHAYGIAAESISVGEAKERWPLMHSDDIIGAAWSPDDGRVNPSDLCAALSKGARSRGARIFEDTPVIGIETEAGRVVAVQTEHGRVRCDAVALCTGLWSRDCAAMAGVSAPVWPCEHYYLLTKTVAGCEGHLPTLGDHDGCLYIRDESGGLLIGCFEPSARPLDQARIDELGAFTLFAEDWDHFEPMMHNALHRLPILETVEVKMLLNGPESFTPDGSFMLGESAETRGFFLGCGMNSVGVASSGGAGMALAHNIVHGRPAVDLTEADPKRFHVTQSSVEALSARAPEVLGKHYELTRPGRQFHTARGLRHTPLHARWCTARAHFGQVYAWERPLYFGADSEPELSFARPAWFEQVASEVQRAHQGAGIFDQSTFGKILVEGPDAESFLDRICANNMKRAAGRAIYTAMLNEEGGFESDLTVLRLSDSAYRLYVGTGAIARDLAWLRRNLGVAERVTLRDQTEDYAVLGLQGPATADIAEKLGAGELNGLGFFRHTETEVAGVAVRAVRLSYVGEAGWELTCAAADAPRLYDALSGAGAAPAGLFAQTSMRIEKRYLSMGHDLDGDVTPLEAGLDFALAWDSDFIGREALLRRREQGVKSQLVSLIFTDRKAYPLGNEPVYFNGTIVGQTTSASYGYRVDAPLALAYLDRTMVAELGSGTVDVDIAREMVTATVSVSAVFDAGGSRLR